MALVLHMASAFLWKSAQQKRAGACEPDEVAFEPEQPGGHSAGAPGLRAWNQGTPLPTGAGALKAPPSYLLARAAFDPHACGSHGNDWACRESPRLRGTRRTRRTAVDRRALLRLSRSRAATVLAPYSPVVLGKELHRRPQVGSNHGADLPSALHLDPRLAELRATSAERTFHGNPFLIPKSTSL
jgi:hypothetical protein